MPKIINEYDFDFKILFYTKQIIMKRILLILLFLPLLACAQNFNVTDTTIILANINEGCTSLLDSLKEPSTIKADGIAFIAGIDNTEYRDLFKIMYKGNFFYIDKDDVSFPNNKDNLDYFTEIKNLNKADKAALERNALIIGMIFHEKRAKEFMDFINKCKKYGICICNYDIYDESEYTDGTSAKITLLNPTNKTIKYIWVTFIGYNSVDDPIISRNGKYRVTMKCIGPIKPKISASYSFDYLWFTDVVESVKIANIKVQYMDRTIKNIPYPSKTMMKESLYNYFDDNDETDDE